MSDYQEIVAQSWLVVKREARRRRRKREWKIAGAIVSPVLLAGLVALASVGTRPGTEQVVDAPAVQEPPSLSLEISEEGLLEQLADQGPILVEQEDGTKKLILTRPKRLKL